MRAHQHRFNDLAVRQLCGTTLVDVRLQRRLDLLKLSDLTTDARRAVEQQGAHLFAAVCVPVHHSRSDRMGREETRMRPRRNHDLEPAGPLLRAFSAGVAGTAAMTLSQKVEMALTGRSPSTSPAEAACIVLGIQTRSEAQEHRLATEAHWAYGAGWGLGHLLTSRLPQPARTLLYFGAVWGSGAALLAATGVAPPPTKWKPKSLITDLLHHAIYTVAGGAAYRLLAGEGREGRRAAALEGA